MILVAHAAGRAWSHAQVLASVSCRRQKSCRSLCCQPDLAEASRYNLDKPGLRSFEASNPATGHTRVEHSAFCNTILCKSRAWKHTKMQEGGARRRNASAACSCTIIAGVLCLLLSVWHLNGTASSPSGLERSFKRLQSPAELFRSFPLPFTLKRLVNESRAEAAAILQGRDDRLIAVVGPCSIHDPEAARDYARRLREVKVEFEEDLLIIMRTYLEKPRTSVGWRGLISDPDLSGAEDLGRGLALGRRVLLDMNALGLPTAVEFLDPLVAPYIEDAVTYGSIGARTVESPIHRALAASLKMPMGFKNSRSGPSHAVLGRHR